MINFKKNKITQMNKYFISVLGFFLFISVSFLSDNLFSQKLNLEETVNYINEKINENNNYKTIFHISEYGSTKITFEAEGTTGKQIVKFNFHDIDEINYVNDDEDYYFCVKLSCSSGNCIRSDSFGDGKYITGLSYWLFCNNTETDAKSLVKAFNHLKSLIKTDPFE